MDVLYVLGTGSKFNNEELKFSLRSLERFGKNIGRIILIGEKPDFLDYSKIEHHPFEESGVKEYRIASKILFACEEGIVSGNFLFCNDDFFFTQSFDANNYPFYNKGSLLNGEPKTAYQEHLKITRDFLVSKGKSTKHFDVHTPIIYNSEKFMALRECWETSKKTIGMVVKSIYCNMYGFLGMPYNDIKLKSLQLPSDLNLLKTSNCFSIADEAWNKGVKNHLQHLFPTKSKYEL